MPEFILTPRAKADLKNIGRYTQNEWGVQQRNKYLLGLEQRFGWLANNAYMGVRRDDIKKGYYCFPHEKHMIFCMISDSQDIHIIGLVGFGQSLEKYFH